MTFIRLRQTVLIDIVLCETDYLTEAEVKKEELRKALKVIESEVPNSEVIVMSQDIDIDEDA